MASGIDQLLTTEDLNTTVNIEITGNTVNQNSSGVKGLAGRLIHDLVAIGVSYLFTFLFEDLMYYDWDLKRAAEHCWWFILGPAMFLFDVVDVELKKILKKIIDKIKSKIHSKHPWLP